MFVVGEHEKCGFQRFPRVIQPVVYNSGDVLLNPEMYPCRDKVGPKISQAFLKPGKNDIKTNILISGQEITELKRHTWMMDEAFGLDSRIEKYKGTKQIGLYSWDFDCLIDSVDYALNDHR